MDSSTPTADTEVVDDLATDEGDLEVAVTEDAPRSSTRSIIEWSFVIVGAFLLAYTANIFLVQAFWIPSESMEPTLVKDDRILVNKIGNRFSDPGRGDLVVFRRPEGAASGPDQPKDLIKRVVGLPNETVAYADGQVIIDGDPLVEDYLPAETQTFPISDEFSSLTLGDDEYLMLGDNRDDSWDGRAWGPLRRDEMVGRAFVKFWPISDIGFL